MNLFMNTKAFVIIGIGVMAGGVVLAAVLQPGDRQGQPLDDPTPTVVDDEVDPEVTPTPDPRQFSEAEDVVDADANDYTAVITTDKGEIEIDLFEEEAPNTVNSFVFLAQNGYFDDLRWHRIEPGFVAQAGDPLSEDGRELADEGLIGTGGPGYMTEDEPNEISNTRGTISMAKAGSDAAFGSQFFINLDENTHLDTDASGNTFYPFAQVTSGMDIVDQLEQWDVIRSIEVSEAPK